MQEAREGWVYVRKYVAPWDPCSPLPLVSPIQTVREPTSMCNDLSLIRATSAPAQRLGLLSLVESRPATAAWTSESASERTEGAEADASRGGGGSSRASSLGAFARQMERLNAEQTALNRRRLKLYIKVFGPAYKGEGQAGAAEDDYYHTPSVGAKPETFADSLLALVGLPTSPTTPQNGQPAVSGDTQLQQLLHHFSKAQPDWSRVTKDWDAVGKQAPALLRVSESSFHTILERLRDGESVGSLAADSSASAARVGMSVAGAADARPRTKTRGEIALATALEEEEVKLLAAEEDTLLLRRAAAARALGLRARESV